MRRVVRRWPAGISNQRGHVDLEEIEVVQVETPAPDRCDGRACVSLYIYPCIFEGSMTRKDGNSGRPYPGRDTT